MLGLGMTLLLLLACSGGKSTDTPPPPCSYDWTDAPCSEQYLDRVRCDPCGKAWKCGPVDWEERYPIWVRQDHDCTCESENGLWYEEPGCGGEAE
jgi:hypothetical protein